MSNRRTSRFPVCDAHRRFFQPQLEALEDRLAPANLGPLAESVLAFDPAAGLLTLNGSAQVAQVAVTTNAVAVTVANQLYSSNAASAAFDPALAGANAATLHTIQLNGGGAADALALEDATTAGNLTINTDGSLTLAGKVSVGGQLTVTAAALTVTGTTSATGLTLTSAGLLSIASGGTLVAQSGGTIAATANDFVNVGQILADGRQGGQVYVSASDYLNAGTLSAVGSAGAGGLIWVNFAESYIDTAAALTAASGVGAAGGRLRINGGDSGRLFSSGDFGATGSNGGSVDLFGQSIALVGASVDASGTAGAGGQVRIGGDYQVQNPAVPNAQTVQLTGGTSVRAEGTGAGGRVIVWSEANTACAASVSAQGGDGGAGGFIEISSHGQLTYGGQANAGVGGTLLLDPQNLVVSAAPAGVFPQFNLVNPGTGGQFGTQVVTLSTGNIVVTDPQVNGSAGAVYLFNGTTGALLSTLQGSYAGDQVDSNGVTALPNGNYVVDNFNWNSGRGAVTWGSGTTGVNGVVSASNSLVGASTGDYVGGRPYGDVDSVTVLPNGNYVVTSPRWNDSTGAVTWGSGTAGVSGVVSASNSLVGASTGDAVGSSYGGLVIGVTALANGNYVVVSPYWNGARGAVTWGSGTAGVSGVVSASNSLVGGSTGDSVGLSPSFFGGGVTALANGNYVVASPNWNGSEGAVTWGSGTAGVSGVVSANNSLVGNTPTNFPQGSDFGDQVGSEGVTMLPNGNYVVVSFDWNSDSGAVTWGSGTAGISGVVSASNSLVGSTPSNSQGSGGDQVGSNAVTALANGNYVVDSATWNGNEGAVTWGSGTAGVSGVVSASNSLVGSHGGDYVGLIFAPPDVTALPNGNYVVVSPNWNGGVGAVTWGSGTAGVSGVVSATNSLVGANPGDEVGGGSNENGLPVGGVTALANGNYVVASPDWNGGEGAVTWGSGTAGVSGVVSTSNSLVGGNPGDYVGGDTNQIGYLAGGVTALPNGNYVVASPGWNGDEGALTWGSGTAGVSGVVSASNSLLGSTPSNSLGSGGDQVGSGKVTTLANGNYVVDIPNWNGGEGAVTWGSGTAGVSGVVSASNSLVGSTPNNSLGSGGDQVGSGKVTTLANGNYVVASPNWNGDDGAVTWGSGTAGISGVVSASNSLVGSTPNNSQGSGGDQVGRNAVTALPNGNYVVVSPNWNSDQGAGTWVNGTNGTTLDGQNTIDAQNSLLGLSANAGLYAVLPGTLSGSFIGLLGGATGGAAIVGFTDPNQLTSTLAQNQTITVTPAFLSSSLNQGNNVTLQANNSIQINAPLNFAGGSLALNAPMVSLSTSTALGVILAGTTPGGGVAGTYTQLSVTGPLNLAGATLHVTHSASTPIGTIFTFVQTTGGVSGTFAGLPEGAVVTEPDHTFFTISYLANGGQDVTLTQVLRPYATITPVSPNPSNSAVSSIPITFNEAVSGFTLADLQLTRNGTAEPLIGATLTSPDNINWILGNLDSLTGFPDTVDNYTLTLVAANSGIVDANNKAILANAATSFTVLDPTVFQVQSTTLTVEGSTSGNDTFTFSAGASDQVSLNGASFPVDPAAITTIHYVSNGANDNATLTGSSGAMAVLWPTDTALTTNGITVDAANCASVTVNSGGPDGTAYFAVTGPDIFNGTPTFSQVQGSGFNNVAVGFAQVAAFASSPNAVAYLVTSTGNDTFGGLPAYSFVSGTGYASYAVGFAVVDGYAGGSNTKAFLATTPTGADTFVGTPTYSQVRGTAYVANAIGFALVGCNAGGPNSVADLTTTATGADTFGGRPDYSFVMGNNYASYAIGFARVNGYAGGANSMARLGTTTTGSDIFRSSAVYSAVSGTNYTLYAVGFSQVQGYSNSPFAIAYLETAATTDTVNAGPGTSTVSGANYSTTVYGFVNVQIWAGAANGSASLTTGTGTATYVGTPTYSDVIDAFYGVFVIGFATVTATAGSSNSIADLYDSPGNTNTFTGSGNQGQLTGPGYSVQGTGFGTVNIHATPGSTDTSSTSALDYAFTKYGSWL